MKAIQFSKYGGPEVLEYVDVETPTVGDNEVLINVKASGVNYADIARRQGEYVVPTELPFIVGTEIAGIIEQVGKKVDADKVGTRALAMILAGGYAEQVVVRESELIPLSDAVSYEEAVAIPVQGLSAYHVLKTMGRLEKGETVLVHAASGGVGLLAVQLAKLFGAGKVIATASTEEKLALAKEMGADHLVNYSEDGWEKEIRSLTDGKGVDVALEMVGGDVFYKTLKLLAPFGRMVVYGVASGEMPKFYPSSLMERNQSVIGFFLPQIMAKPQLFRSSLLELLQLIEAGELKLTIGGSYPLAEAERVHQLFQDRKTTGKIVLIP